MKRMFCASILGLLSLSVLSPLRAGETVVYRCVDAQGNVSLQDRACAARQSQQRRSIPGPVDAPVPPAAAAPAARAAPGADDVSTPPPPSVAIAIPQPLYECRREDGSVYESTTGVPERRWVPVWVIGRDARAATPSRSTVGMPRHRLPVVDGGVAYGAGTWVEDECYQLPQAEVCTRRRGRLTDLEHQRRLAFPSDRVSLDLQYRGLREQLQRECGYR